MDDDRVEFRVAMMLPVDDSEHMSEPDVFPDLKAARAFMQVAARFGVGTILFAIVCINGAPDYSTMTEVMRLAVSSELG